MDEPGAWEHYAGWNKPVTKGQMLYDSTYMRLQWVEKLTENREERWLPGRGEEGKAESVFNWQGVSAGEDESTLEMGGGDGHTTKWLHLMPPNCTLNNTENGNFMLRRFYHNQKIKFKTGILKKRDDKWSYFGSWTRKNSSKGHCWDNRHDLNTDCELGN